MFHIVTPARSTSRTMAPFTLGVGVALLLLLSVACVSGVDRGEWARGNVLRMNLSNYQRLPEVPYTVDGISYVIRPQTPGHTLAVAKVLIRNDRSAEVSMLVDETAAFLADRQYKRHGLINPHTRRQLLAQPPAQGDRFLPFLWGVVSVPRGFQIEGWVVFEIPEEFAVYQFNWEQADSIRVRLEGSS